MYKYNLQTKRKYMNKDLKMRKAQPKAQCKAQLEQT